MNLGDLQALTAAGESPTLEFKKSTAEKDRACRSGSIGVALYDDRLEIISPGELHFGLTPEKLLQPHESRPWNPLIASTFYRRGHIEKWGRGILKIVDLMKAAGQQPPKMVSADGFVTVTFMRPDKVEASGGVSGGASGGVSGGASGGVSALLDHIQRHPGQNAAQLATAMEATRRTTERWLQQLKAAGKIEFRGAPKTGGYHASK